MYPWKRFWCPRDGAFSLADRGYLYDPDSEHGKAANPHVVAFDEIVVKPCLVLLGEPGIGKTTAIQTEARQVGPIVTGMDGAFLSIDLKDYSTDTRLVQDSFESDVVHDWRRGHHTLHLNLDSLDEGRLEIRNLANILATELKKCSGQVSRLRLRVACRTAEWPMSLESVLIDLWGKENVGIYEQIPLRRQDVAIAAEMEGLTADAFFEEIAQKEAEPLAINPITLRFLLQIKKRDGELPSTKRDLYEQGCLALCEETSESRRDARRFGDLSAKQRLEIASRIACITVFCDRPTIFMGHAATVDAQDVLTLSDLDGSIEQVGDDRFGVSESSIREVVGTALFSGRGPQKRGFAHRTYAEYLAARYLARRCLDHTQTHSLVFHAESPEGRVIPQLGETAAWIAGTSHRLFDSIAASDPQILLRSDVARADDSSKAAVVSSLLDGFANEKLDDANWDLRSDYHKLKHMTLSDQLCPFIQDRNYNRTVRRFAVDLAKACREKNLLNILAEVALDQTDDTHIRHRAAHAIVEIGDETSIQQLKPLALGASGPDPQDELRGAAMRGLWPRWMTADELFSNLLPPKQESFIGTYRVFVNYELAQHLTSDHLVPALRWCAKQPLHDPACLSFDKLMQRIVQLAWEHLDSPDVLNEFAQYAATRIDHHDGLGVELDSLSPLESDTRRTLIEATVPKIANFDQYAINLIDGELALVMRDDMEWLINQVASATSDESAQRWAKLARMLCRIDLAEFHDQIILACASHTALRTEFADLLEPIELGSPKAEELQRRYRRHLEFERKMEARRERPIPDPPPVERVLHCLQQFEEGNIDSWYILNNELQLKPTDTHYHHHLQPDLTQLPGWSEADEITRQRIVEAAKRYVDLRNTEPEKRLGKSLSLNLSLFVEGQSGQNT